MDEQGLSLHGVTMVNYWKGDTRKRWEDQDEYGLPEAQVKLQRYSPEIYMRSHPPC